LGRGSQGNKRPILAPTTANLTTITLIWFLLSLNSYWIPNFIESQSIGMASIRCTTFSAKKIHDSMYREEGTGTKRDSSPLSEMMKIPHARYNSKLMNSIWGLYNQYAPHAFQKNQELSSLLVPPASGLIRVGRDMTSSHH
jgi:hypothetical protein